jgi:hypothetical protein
MSEDHEFDGAALRSRLAEAGRRLSQRETSEAGRLAAARRAAARLHAFVSQGLEGFRAAIDEAGAGQLAVEISELRTDDKHLHSVQFDLRRGRHAAIVTVKSKGEVTLVGPFRAGKGEGPCLSFPFGSEPELEAALADFLERFLEQAATP